MGLVDTVMVGRLGPAAIAATGMGSGVFTAIAIFGMGLMLGVDALVSQSAGATFHRSAASLLLLHARAREHGELLRRLPRGPDLSHHVDRISDHRCMGPQP